MGCKCNFLYFQLGSLDKPRALTILNNWKYGKCSISDNFTNRKIIYTNFTILMLNFGYLFIQYFLTEIHSLSLPRLIYY